MSIDPIGSVDGTTGTIAVAPLYDIDPSERRLEARQEYDLSRLTPGDQDFLSAVFGPRVITIEDLAQAREVSQDRAEAVLEAVALSDAREAARLQANQFVSDLLQDRQNGVLPAGTEITASYVEARFDQYAEVNESVTAQNRAAAQEYFSDRVQGAQVDLLA